MRHINRATSRHKLTKLLIITVGSTVVGIALILYGGIKAPIANEQQILVHYRCDRLTNEGLSTDIYCSKPETAPEAEKNFANSYVIAGFAMVAAGRAYAIALRPTRKKL